MVIKITPQQAKRVNALLRKLCANYDGGNCLLLDDGEPCVCVQSISKYGIYCNYFKNAVLPVDEGLHAEIPIFHHPSGAGTAAFRTRKGLPPVCRTGCSRPYRAPPSGAGQGQPHLLKGVYPKVRFSEFQKSGNRKEIRLRE